MTILNLNQANKYFETIKNASTVSKKNEEGVANGAGVYNSEVLKNNSPMK